MNVHLKSLLASFAFSFLLYSKSFGLNVFLIAILVLVLVSTAKKDQAVSWRYAATYIATAAFVFLNPTGFTIFVHFMAFMVFMGKSISRKNALYIAWLIGVINMLIASPAYYTDQDRANKEKRGISQKLLNRIKGGFAASLLLLIFGLLYRDANPVFSGLMEQIDLSFISVPWMFFTLLGYVIFLHILRPFNAKELANFDLEQGNYLEKPTEIELIAAKKKLESEHTLGSMVFIALNLLLVFFLSTDVVYLLQENEITNAGYSASVHQGVYALMFSIVCAIILILYFFRGKLNFFNGNKRIKILTYIWIALNVALVALTCFKNLAYVEALGLTYKRIGVFVYLLLTLTGLVTAYIKVAGLKNFVYLVRANTATIFAFLVISALIPWNQAITGYNLKHMEHPDLDYLIDLDHNNSEQLYHFAQEEPQKVPWNAKRSIHEKYSIFRDTQAEKTWQEYSFYNLVQSTSK